MQTTYDVLYTNAPMVRSSIMLPDIAAHKALTRLLRPILGCNVAQCRVWVDDRMCDMFLCDLSYCRFASSGVAFNHRATVLYRNFLMRSVARCDPDTMPAVLGPAVLFDRLVS